MITDSMKLVTRRDAAQWAAEILGDMHFDDRDLSELILAGWLWENFSGCSYDSVKHQIPDDLYAFIIEQEC